MSIVLLAATFLVLGFWIWSPRRNYDLATAWFLSASGQANPQFEWALALSAASIYGFLLYFFYDPATYAVVFVLYCALYLAATASTRARAKGFLAATRQTLDGTITPQGTTEVALAGVHYRALDVLERYFVQRPQRRRVALMTAAALFICALSRIGVLYRWPWQNVTTSALLTATLLVSESFIVVWRHSRDREIASLEAERDMLVKRLASAGPRRSQEERTSALEP
jgi:hypothetical protein